LKRKETTWGKRGISKGEHIINERDEERIIIYLLTKIVLFQPRFAESTRDAWLTQGRKPVSAWRCDAVTLRGPEAAAQQAQKERPAEREAKEEEGVEERKEGTTGSRSSGFYTWAKRREGAFPDRAGLNRKWHRNGSDFTAEVFVHIWP
jgi:hypothetical protein